MMSVALTIYTIGHSNHSQERFVELLQQHGIEAVADVRRWPTSAFCPHYNRKAMEVWLPEAGIEYHFFGKELGGKRSDEAALTDGRMDIEKIRKLPDFTARIERLLELTGAKRMAVMCGEGDPIRCHRHWLIAQDLLDKNISVVHILPDGHSVPAARERRERQLGLF